MQRDTQDMGTSALLRQEARTVLRQVIARLPTLYRTVYVLAACKDLPHHEIGILLAVSVDADYFVERKPTAAGRNTAETARHLAVATARRGVATALCPRLTAAGRWVSPAAGPPPIPGASGRHGTVPAA